MKVRNGLALALFGVLLVFCVGKVQAACSTCGAYGGSGYPGYTPGGYGPLYGTTYGPQYGQQYGGVYGSQYRTPGRCGVRSSCGSSRCGGSSVCGGSRGGCGVSGCASCAPVVRAPYAPIVQAPCAVCPTSYARPVAVPVSRPCTTCLSGYAGSSWGPPRVSAPAGNVTVNVFVPVTVNVAAVPRPKYAW